MMAISCRDARRLKTPGPGCRCAALVVLLLLGVSPSEAQLPVRNVLMLQSLDRGNMTLDQFTGNFRVELDQRTERLVNLVQVVVGPTGFVGAPEQAIVDFIRSTFADRPKPDLLVTTGGPAAVFARKYRDQLFPDVPLLFASVDQRFLDAAPLRDTESAVSVTNDYPHLIESMLQLLPQTRQVFMVMGSGQLGEFWHRELETQFKRFRDRLTFIWSDDLSFAEILRRCAALPRDAAIFYLVFGTDAAGAAYADDRVIADLHAAASVPMFAAQSVYFGHGVVGGSMVRVDDLSRTTAEIAVRLLNGEAPNRVRLPPQPKGPPVYDWRELQRWGIAESRLPQGSVVRFRPPGPWSEYRNTVLIAAGVLIVQSLLIVGLLYHRRARRRAELDSRNHLVLAADASRRQMMSALTNSITHELGQPLSSMIHNAQALQLMIAADRAPSGTISEILSDIQAQGVQATQIIERHRNMLRSRELDPQPVDLCVVVRESLALVAHDLRLRNIDAIIDLPTGPCIVNGDQVLLQQVIVNLVMNAIDAMDGAPPTRRRVTVRGEIRSDDVRISVADRGTGLPEELDGKLFAPFVTTKSQGLGIGLTIVRTIVDAHGGSISAFNNSGGGATFTVTLRRNPMPAMQTAPAGAA
jgi:signal transduction histidine kinase